MEEFELLEEGVEFRRHLSEARHRGQSRFADLDLAETNGLELTQDTSDLAAFSPRAPLSGKACADPISKKADAHMVDDAVGTVVKDRPHPQVAFEFAKGFLDFEEILIMALDLCGLSFGGKEIGMQQIPSIVGALGGDDVLFALPVQDSIGVDLIGEVFVGFERLESASGLAGDFLGVWLAAFDRGKLAQGGLGLGDAGRAPLLIALAPPGTAGDDVAF